MIPPVSQEQIEELEAKHGGKLYACDTPQGIVYFHRPPKGEFQRAAQVAANKDASLAQKVNAQELLCASCVVHPTAAMLRELFDEFYAFSGPIAESISLVAKGDEAARVGKSKSASTSPERTHG
ncbi:MAG: hypothetical protein WC683_17890 [bacterium]|nr:hypothetical protein [Syntrophorhabdaceae bacterium]